MPLSTSCLKCLVVTYNILIGISGLALFLINCVLLYKLFYHHDFITVKIAGPSITLIIIGILSCLVSWIGWKAAWYLHHFHIVLVGILLLAIVITEFGCSIWSFVIWHSSNEVLTSPIQESFSMIDVKNIDQEAFKRWDAIQTEMQCCGLRGLSDYNETIPRSCCYNGSSENSSRKGECLETNQRGCLTPLLQMMRELIMYIGLSGLAAGLIQGGGVILAFCLASSLRRAQATAARRGSEARGSLAGAPRRQAPPAPPRAPHAPHAQALLPPTAPDKY